MLHLLDFAVRRCLRDIALQKKYPCLAMPDDTSTNLEHQVYRHERELELDGIFRQVVRTIGALSIRLKPRL
jgi:hypothetical protein